jgi:cytoskeleton protein RodZ
MKEDNLVGRLNITRDNLAPLLKEAREAKGITLEEIADRLKVRPSLLEQIEAGRYESLPEMIYTRSYIQKFAQIVGLAPEPFVAAYERIAANASSPTLARSAVRTVIESAPVIRQEDIPRVNYTPWILGFIGLILIGVLAFFLAQGRLLPRSSTSTKPTTVAMTTPETNPEVNPVQTEIVKLSVQSVPSGATVQLDKYNIGTTPLKGALVASRPNRELRVVKAGFKPYVTNRDLVADSNLSVTLERLSATTLGVTNDKVQLIYKGSSWTRVRDAKGKVIYQGQPKAGERLEFTPPIEVRLGQPNQVSAVVNGQTRGSLGGGSPVTIQLP